MIEVKLRGLLLVLLTTIASAQRSPIFKIDGVSPREGGAAELLQTFCPGKVDVGGKVKCRELPEEISVFDCPPAATMVTRGHFLSPKSDDVLLAFFSCEPHSAHGGSTALFTRDGSTWKLIWRKPGLITDHCHRMPLRTGRQILVCELAEGWPGLRWRALFLVDALREPAIPRDYDDDHEIFGASETIPCGGPAYVVGEPITRAYIERVEFHPRPSGDGDNMTVFAQYGKAALTPEMITACSGPPTKPYHLDFLFDGGSYKVAPNSAGALRLFSHH